MSPLPEYVVILLCIFLLGLFFHVRFRLKLYKSTTHTIFVNAIFLLFGYAWDSYALIKGHWVYDDHFLLGYRVGVVPLEDIGFMFIVPYAILVVYHWHKNRSHAMWWGRKP